MLFVIGAGLVSLAACTAIGVLLIRLSHFVLGGTVSAILLACLFAWWVRQWWKDRKEKYQDYATENEIEYLEELADEHERGVRDRSKELRYLLPLFDRNAREPERYKHRIDNIRRIIGDGDQSSMRAEHERFMQLVAQMPEPSEADKRAIAEMNSPEGWKKAIAVVIADGKPQHRKSK